jgi:hypothetical protein
VALHPSGFKPQAVNLSLALVAPRSVGRHLQSAPIVLSSHATRRDDFSPTTHG